MSTLAVARRYATALVDLTAEQGSLDTVEKDLVGFGSLLSGSPELQAALLNPAFKAEERAKVLVTIIDKFGMHTHSKNFLLVLNDRNRLGAFDAILDELGNQFDARMGRVRARVTSAKALDDASAKALQDHIKKITGANDVVVSRSVDPTLIGGIVTRVGDLVLDGSVRTQLQLLREQLTAGTPVGDA